MQIVYGILWLMMKLFCICIMIAMIPIYIIVSIYEAIKKELDEEQMMRDMNENLNRYYY